MITINKKQNCSGCYSCINVCPKQCIEMIEDNEGFLYPEVDRNKCIDCGLCDTVCPIINNRELIYKSKCTAYACINKTDNIRLQSSSGGIFTLLGENVINNGGVVFGARFDDNFNLVHSYTNNIKDLSEFRGSKYLQSKIGETYKQTKSFLEKNIQVLFSGTPCQIGGLISYLGKQYDNLLCIDIICHGVPSPKVFKKYTLELEKQYNAKVRKIDFRYKDSSWKQYSVSLLFHNDKEYKKNFTQDIYMRGFLQNLYLRPSCHNCKFKTLNRQSDITIADFWGIEIVLPELYDDKGTSLVLINSNKGRKIFQNLQNKMIAKQVNVKEAIKFNPSAIKSDSPNPNRIKFFGKLNSYSVNIDELILKYTKVSIQRRIYRKMKLIFSNMLRS